MLGDQQRESLVLFMDAIAALCAPVQNEGKIPFLKEQVGVALARVERDFPLSLQVKKAEIACERYNKIHCVHLLLIIC